MRRATFLSVLMACLASVGVSSPGLLPTDAASDSIRFMNAPAKLEVRIAKTGHLLVSPKLHGAAVGWFLFDTGASAHALSLEAAKKLKLKGIDKEYFVGVSGKTTACQVVAPSYLQLGPAVFARPRFLTMDLTLLNQQLGTEVQGILGYGIMQSTVVEMDLEKQYLALHEPDSYELNHGSWQGLLLFRGAPFVAARFDGTDGVFRIDSGAPGDTVTFHSAAVEKLQLLKDRDTTPVDVFGTFGALEVQVGRLREFELAGHRFPRPRASFVTSEDGPLATPHSTGNIGGQFLKPFLVVFDYQNARVAFVKRP